MKANKFISGSSSILLVFLILFYVLNTKISYGQCPFSPSYTVSAASTPAGTVITPPVNGEVQGTTGATITISNPGWPNCSNWGYPLTFPVLNGYCVGAPSYDSLTFNPVDPNTNLNNGLMCFTGTTTYRYLNTVGAWVTNAAVQARVRIRVTQTDGVTPIPIQLAGSYLLLQTDLNFRVWYLIEAFSPSDAIYIAPGVANTWYGAINLFNYLNTDPASYIQTTFDYGAYYDINGIGLTAGAVTNPLCYGEDLDLTGSTGNLDLLCTTPSYLWTGPNSYTSTSQNLTIAGATPALNGTYNYYVSDKVCYGGSSVNITVYDDLTASISAASTPAGTVITPPADGVVQGTTGATITITNPGWPKCSNWGYPTMLAVINGNCQGMPTYDNLTFNFGDANTNLDLGLMCFTGFTTYQYNNNVGVMITDNAVPARVRIKVTLTDGVTPIPIQQTGSYLLLQTDQDFRVWYLIEAYSPINAEYFFGGPNTWMGAIDLFNALHTVDGYNVCTTFDYGAYYDINGIGLTAGAVTNPLCYGEDLNLTGSTGNLNLLCTTPSYLWTGPNSFTSTSQNPTITGATPVQSGTYNYYVSDKVCYGGSSVNITVYDDLSATISGGTTPICYNTSPGTFTASGTGGTGSYTYLWYQNGVSTGITTSTFDPGNLTTTPHTFYCDVTSAPCGTVSTSTTTIDLESTPPAITCPSNITQTADAGLCSAIVIITDATATDNCPGVTVAGVRSDALSFAAPFPTGTTTITWTATDGVGLTDVCSQTITVTDDEAPVISCPIDINQTADAGLCAAAVTITDATASDNCPGASVAGVRNDALLLTDPYPVGTTTITWTATDASSNTDVCIQTITVTDDEVPVITCPGNINVSNDAGICGAAVTFTVTATDNCPGTLISQTAGLASGSTFPVGTTTNTFVATDASGNTATCSFDVIVTDNETPVVTCPIDISQTADAGLCSAVVIITDATATDNCPGVTVAGVRSDALLFTDPFPVGTITITWTATDGVGLTDVCTQTISITDNENPVITCPLNITQTADPGLCSASVTILNATATDNCPGVTVNGVRSDELLLTDPYPVGVTTITWIATDGASNNDVCTQTITITDNQPPVINCPGNISVDNDPNVCGAVVNYAFPTITDNCGTIPAPVIPGYSFLGTFNNNSYFLSLAAQDYNNANLAAQALGGHLVYINSATENAFLASAGVDFWTGGVQDLTSPLYSEPGGGWEWLDGNPVTYTNWNAGEPNEGGIGNENNIQYLILSGGAWNDNNPTAPLQYVVEFNGFLSQIAGLPSGSTFPVGTTTNTFVATDASGNTATCSFDVIVTDNEIPVVTCPIDITQTADAGLCSAIVIITDATATDNCPGVTVAGVRSDALLFTDPFPTGTTTITWTATDGIGLTDVCIQTITITDNEAPVIICPIDITQTADAGLCSAAITIVDATATDNCTIGTIIGVRSDAFLLTDPYPVGITTISWTASDTSGNTDVCIQTITVTDDEDPVITCPADITQTADPNLCSAIVAITDATFTDNCPGTTVAGFRNDALQLTDPYPVDTTTIMWVATDASGNTDTCYQLIIVTDNELPSFNIPFYPKTAQEIINQFPGTPDGEYTLYVYGNPLQPFSAYCYDMAGTPREYITLQNTGGTYNHSQYKVGGYISGTDVNTNFTKVRFDPLTMNVNTGDYLFSSSTGYIDEWGTTQISYGTAGACNWWGMTGIGNVDLRGTSFAVNTPWVPAGWAQFGSSTLSSDDQVVDFDGGGQCGSNQPDGCPDNGDFCLNLKYYQATYGTALSINCPSGITQTADPGVCQALVTIPIPGGTDNCAVDTIYNDYTGTSDASGIYPVDTTIVIWTITDIHGNTNTCAQTIIVTDNEVPSITCAPDQTQANDPGVCEAFVTVIPPTVGDNCAVDTVYNDRTLTSDASGIYPVGITALNWTVIDIHGNSNNCTQTITVTDSELPTITCAPSQTQTNDPGMCGAFVTVVPPTFIADNCGVDYFVNDYTGTNDASAYYPVDTTTITWTVFDLGGNSNTCTQIIIVTDDEAPVINCPFAPFGAVRPADSGMCSAYINVPVPFVYDNCAVLNYTNDFTGTADASAVYPVGITTITWTVTDIHGNTSTCQDFINVVDNQNPVVLTQDITVYLNSNGLATIVPADVDNGSYDNCAIINWTLSQSSFTCANVGTPVTVTATATDANGNQSSGTAVVTVLDTIVPIIYCNNITVQLDATGNATITPNLVFNSGYDACGLGTMSVLPNTFTCAEVGANTVTLSVSDLNGNIGTCTATVTVQDNVPPTALCHNITIQLDATGNASILPTDIDNGSSDACGIASITVSPNTFTCANVGINTVVLTVTDNNGNISVCDANVTVQDTTDPVALCQNITVQLDANGNASITPADINAGSSDVCGIASMTLSQSTFDCSDAALPPSGLFFSEYIEGSSNNKALEIFNPTVAAIDLGSGYKIKMYFNGNVGVGTTIDLVGSIPAGGHFVLAHASANAGILAVADMTNSSAWYNGDDAVVLEDPAGNILDIIGRVGEDPGAEWVNGANTTADNTLIRVPSVHKGVTSNPVSGFPTLATEWTQYATNYSADLGTHLINPVTVQTSVLLTVTDVNGNISTCNSTVTLDDTIAPVALCHDLTVQLDAMGNASITAADIDNGSSDACGIAALAVSPSSFTCANVGANTVTLTATDNHGNISTCSATVTIEDNVAPAAVCQNINVYLDATGNASILPDDVDNGSNDACGIDTMFVSPETFTCTNVGPNVVTLTVTDVNGNSSTCSATATVIDTISPAAVCQNITIQLDASGNAAITPAQVNNGSTDVCGIASMSVLPNTFTCANVGPNTVTLTVTDINGNSSTCTSIVTVQDLIPPVALCQNITVPLDATGNASILAAQIDNVSNDACGIATMTVSPNVFTCANVGANTVTLTVTDNNGNVSSCNATVIVQDVTPPVAVCQNITIQLDVNGNASIIPAQINNGSTDACGIASLAVSPNTFSCANVGSNSVTLTVTDNNGNVTTCTATVTVQDNIPPVAICHNITAQLDATGNVTITGSQVDNGSHDACGIASLVVAPNTFTCANIGQNAVTLTVTDNNGNVSTCSATVVVEDNVHPVALCHNLSIYLDQTGHVSIVPADVNNGSSDACGIASLTVYPNSFNCANIGSNIVTLTVTDVNGNVSTCNSEISVYDTIAPVILCPNNISLVSAAGACDYSDVNLNNPTFSDNCYVNSVVNNALTTYPLGLTHVTWTISDGSGNSTSCVQDVYIESAPLAVNDTASTLESTPVVVPVLANDIDCGNNLDPASVTVINPPANGSVSVDILTGNITYTPDYLFTGNDEFDYRVCDSTGLCSSATVYVNVIPVNNPSLGIAKALQNVNPLDDNTFDVTYLITLENLGNDKIEHIQVTDDLAATFPTPVTFTVVDVSNTNNTITPNSQFDGISDINLLESSVSFLDIGKTATITFTINVKLLGSVQDFCNTATATGIGKMLGVVVTDISDNGYVTDANANLNPGDEGENDCTPLVLTPMDVFIPEAFSPDGDGKNDFFVMNGEELYPENEFTVFNRWGNVVYHKKPYDDSWDGTSDNVLTLGSKKLPQGTYYYVFEYNKDNRNPRKGFIVIKY